MGNIPHLFNRERVHSYTICHPDQPAVVELTSFDLNCDLNNFGLAIRGVICRYDGAVGFKEIQKGKSDHQEKAGQESGDQPRNLAVGHQFLCAVKFDGLKKIKDQQASRQDKIIGAVFQEGPRSGGEKTKMAAVKNKSGHIPAHDKSACGGTDDGAAECIHIIQVFGSQEKCVGSKGMHKTSVNGGKQDYPEKQEQAGIFSGRVITAEQEKNNKLISGILSCRAGSRGKLV